MTKPSLFPHLVTIIFLSLCISCHQNDKESSELIEEYEYNISSVKGNHREDIVINMDSIVNILGLIGSIGISVMLIPQIYKVYKTKISEGLSYLFLFINIFSGILMLIYGIYYYLLPVMLINSCVLLSICILIYLKYTIENFKKFNNHCIIDDDNISDIII